MTMPNRTPERYWTWVVRIFLVVVLACSITGAAAEDSPPTVHLLGADVAELSGKIVADGSATVAPITEAVAEDFVAIAPRVQLEVSVSGTGGGFDRFCKGETDIQNASRAIRPEELAACGANGIDFYVFRVAFDGIAVVVNPDNEFVTCLTVDQLQSMWRPDDAVNNWNKIDPSFPDRRIRLYGPGTSSGTFDYFTQVIVGEEGTSNIDYLPSEDPNQLVEGVAGDKDALGYFGLAYYEENQDRLHLVAIDDGQGCIEPTVRTVSTLEYTPLSRPLYIYVNAASIERPEMQEFLTFYLAVAQELAADVGYVASPEEVYRADREKLTAAIGGNGIPDSAATPEPIR